MCLCLPVQPQHPTQPVPAAQKALPESGSSRVVLVPEVGDLSAVNLAGQRRHSRKSETLQPQHLLVFPAALCMLRSAVPRLPAQNCIELLPVLLRVKPIAGPAVPDDVDPVTVAVHECLVQIQQEYRRPLAQQQLYALHQFFHIPPPQDFCDPVQDQQLSPPEPHPKYTEAVIIQQGEVGKPALQRHTQFHPLPDLLALRTVQAPDRAPSLRPAGRTVQRQQEVPHRQLLRMEPVPVHDPGVLQDPAFQFQRAHPTAAGKGPSPLQVCAALEQVQICGAGGKMVVHIDPDALPPGNGDFKTVEFVLPAEAAVLHPDQFLSHGSTPPGNAAAASRSTPCQRPRR